MLSTVALQPPQTKWDGPQPGLLEQSDAKHRFIFSPQHGRIDAVICYDDAGIPTCRVAYKEAIPQAIHNWNGFNFEYAGKINSAGEIIQEEIFDRTMLDAVGREKIMPQEKNIFITPAGFVVKLLRSAGIFWKARAQYVGRLKKFSAEQPFQYATPSGVRTLQPGEKDILINLDGSVFVSTSSGLKTVGKLLPYIHTENFEKKDVDFSDDLIALSRKNNEFSAKILHPNHAALFDGPLPIISGRHPFVQRNAPEIGYTTGAQRGEVALRNLEKAAFQLALVTRAMHDAQKNAGEKYSLLVAAHSALEIRVWIAAAEFEKIIDATPHTVINAEFIRAWIDGAIEDPHRALAALIDESEMAYAH